MKVTVTFGNVRVIVPCGNGDISVRDLMDLAITRYKKATGKPPNSWVTIHNLKICKDEGILYPDDRLTDVADDREQIIAVFEEQSSYLPLHNGGDGTSASSIGTNSPDIFRTIKDTHFSQSGYNDVEITDDCVPNGLIPLHVRRGSEPTLTYPDNNCTDLNKRWSTAVIVNNGHSKHSRNSQEDSSDDSDIPGDREDGNGEEMLRTQFSRSPGRLSVVRNDFELYEWQDKYEKQERKEPLGGSGSSSDCHSPDRIDDDSDEEKELVIILQKDTGPLGIHVVPNYDKKGRDKGLIIQGIEKGGRIYHDGRISVGDCIMEINGHRLCEVSFQTAQEIFKKALDANEIKLSLIKNLSVFSSNVSKKLPPPVYPKPSLQTNIDWKEQKDENLTPAKSHIHSVNTLTSNTRKIGKKIHIQLKKGCFGLGFSVTTRDNPAGKNCPIYIKNILSKGSAIEDGKLKPGDRLLEVNGIEVTGKSQDEVVTMLRSIPQDEIVNLLVSRQMLDACSPSPNLPRKLSSDNSGEQYGLLSKHREIITLEIPLNDTGSAGLGVSVKGKTSTVNEHSTDLGIFVKSVIHGGAASKDGRLQPNDQLININGTSLLKMTNTQAMETLRRAMTQGDSPNPNAILLTIARRISSYENLDNCHQRSDSIISGSGESDGSATIICGNFGIFSNQSNVCPDTKKVDNTSNCNNIHEGSIYRKFSLPTRHPVIDFLMGQTPKSDSNLSANLSDNEFLMTSNSPNNTTVKKMTNCNSLPNSEKHRKISAPGHLFSTINSQIKNETPELNRKTSETFDSQQSLNEDDLRFSRDGFGRQSMSEKRHAHLDAKNTDTYQRTKKAKEEREKWKQKLLMQESHSYSSEQLREARKWKRNSSEIDSDLSFGMRKSCSLESLQTVLQEIQKEENIFNMMPSYITMSSKERKCNDSFRAAVDRSYEAMQKGTMEILQEDNENIHPDKRLEYDSSQTTFNIVHDDMFYPYSNKINESKKKKLLKGIGSVFSRFGKNRKSDSSKKITEEELRQEAERLRAKWAAQEEHERIQEHYKRFVEQQKHEQQMKNHTFASPILSSVQSHYTLSPQQRQRLQFLKSRYQQCYDDDELHDWNEQETKEILVRQPSLPLFSSHQRYKAGMRHHSPEVFSTNFPRSPSRKIDIYKEMERAGSRTGISDPKVYEHYMNYSGSSNPSSPLKNITSRNFYSPQLNNSKNNDSDKMLQEESKHSSMKEALENKSPYKNEKCSNINSNYSSSRKYYASYHQTTSKFPNNSPACSNNRRQNNSTGSKV